MASVQSAVKQRSLSNSNYPCRRPKFTSYGYKFIVADLVGRLARKCAVLPSRGLPSYYNGQVNNLSSDELRNWATVVAASVALLVFVVNSFFLVRNQRLENVSRFIEAHQRLFAWDGFIAKNMALIETGTLTRDRSDKEMEARFHLMLLEVERLAILANNNAVPRATQVYMFGWYARNILTVITEKERDNMSWELVLGYLDGLGKDYTAYENLTRNQRERYWR